MASKVDEGEGEDGSRLYDGTNGDTPQASDSPPAGAVKKRQPSKRDYTITLLVVAAVIWWLGGMNFIGGKLGDLLSDETNTLDKTQKSFFVIIPLGDHTVMDNGKYSAEFLNSYREDMTIKKIKVRNLKTGIACVVKTQTPFYLRPLQKFSLEGSECAVQGAKIGEKYHLEVAITAQLKRDSQIPYDPATALMVKQTGSTAELTSTGTLTGTYI